LLNSKKLDFMGLSEKSGSPMFPTCENRIPDQKNFQTLWRKDNRKGTEVCFMKAIIIYESAHHGNTKKLVQAIAAKYHVETASIEGAESIDLSSYDRIGLASGIAFGKFYKRMEKFAEKIPAGARVFLLYTCGNPAGGYVKSITRTLEANGAKVVGNYGCKGYDTYGPFKLVGGIAKGHPTEEEIARAVEFYSKIRGKE
jgi:flavodoxin